MYLNNGESDRNIYCLMQKFTFMLTGIIYFTTGIHAQTERKAFYFYADIQFHSPKTDPL